MTLAQVADSEFVRRLCGHPAEGTAAFGPPGRGVVYRKGGPCLANRNPEPAADSIKISVCMATYNGERFVGEQLDSILSQLREHDEVVVVDDASRDGTVAAIRELADDRIRLEKNRRNLGVLASFERAIRAATGEVLFLSDQDDVWLPEKVTSVLSAFRRHPDVTMISTDVDIVDGDGQLLSAGFPRVRFGDETRGRKLLRNLYKNRYLGCTLAFRASVVSHILPFPPDIPMHDMWIGMVNDIVGRTHFLDQRLVRYRRHDSNTTTGRPLAPPLQIKNRLVLLRRLVEFWYRRRSVDE